MEAEQALLGAILINNEALYRVSDFLEPKHFFEPINGQIFELAGRLVNLNKRADTISLKNHLPGEANIEGLSVNQYLARLAAEATTIINAEDYGRIVYYLSVRRALIAIGEDIVNLAYDAPVEATPTSHIEDAERKLYEVAERGRYESGFHTFGKALTKAVDMTAAAYQRDGKLSGLASGLVDLDSKMGGLQASDLIVLAGRPGMGKTSLATNIAYNIAKAWQGEQRADGHIKTIDGGVVGFFSLEMSAEQLATRIIAEQTGIPSTDMRRGVIDDLSFEAIKDKVAEIQNLPLFIDDTGGLSIGQLAARARRLKRQRGLDLMVIDYIQLMQGSTRRALEGRVHEVTEITTGLRLSPRSLTSQSWRCRSCPVRSKAERISARNCLICENRGRSSRMLTLCCLYSVRNITTKCANQQNRTEKSSPNGWPRANAWKVRRRSSLANNVTAPRARSNSNSRPASRGLPISTPHIGRAFRLAAAQALPRPRPRS